VRKRPGVIAVLALLAVLALPAAAADATFPGTDGQVVFTSERFLFTVDATGGNWTRLVTSTMRQGQPVWSPDGRRVAFRGGPDGDSEVWVVSADGTGLAKLTTTPDVGTSERFSSQPAWSPNGSQIAFRSDRRDNNGDIWIMDAGGTNVRPLIQTAGDERYPAISPDGTRIAYRSDVDGDDEIYVAGIDGRVATKLTSNRSYDSAPQWSPDGRRLAFERGPPGARDEGNPAYQRIDLWSMAADGSDQRRLTANAVNDSGAAWAPGGSGALVFTRDEPGLEPDLWIRDPDGVERPLTNSVGSQEWPDWQPVPPGTTPLRPPNFKAIVPPPPPQRSAQSQFRVVNRQVRVSRTGVASLRLRGRLGYRGAVSLVRGSARLARARTTVPAGRTVTVRLRLSRATLRRLAGAGRLAVRLRPGNTRMTLLAPRR
jgi:dipeptidyl aminopeptidase/acylaminoacyl peptidase